MLYFTEYTYPLGSLYLTEENGAITFLSFTKPKTAFYRQTSLLKQACLQLDEYFSAKRQYFDLPLQFSGTAFEQKVWQKMLQIPYGKTYSYSQIAEAVGSPKAARAVGRACNKNKIAIIIPCHRVIGIDKNLTGYAGGLIVKQFLLNLEKGK